LGVLDALQVWEGAGPPPAPRPPPPPPRPHAPPGPPPPPPALSLCVRARAPRPPPPCIVLTAFDDDELVLRAIARGARGYLLKDVTLEQLTAAIRTVADGGSVINPAVTERVLRGIERLGAGFESLPVPDALTKRELEIV